MAVTSRTPPLIRQATLLLACLLVSLLGSPGASSAGTKRVDQLYSQLQAVDRLRAEKAVQTALETMLSRTSFDWKDDIGELRGRVTPLRTFKVSSGHYCREYREEIHLLKAWLSATRTACRNGAGVWERIQR